METHQKSRTPYFSSIYSSKIELHPSEKRVKDPPKMPKIRTDGRKGPGSAFQKIRIKNFEPKNPTLKKVSIGVCAESANQKIRPQKLELRSSSTDSSLVENQNIKKSPKLE